MLVVVFVVLFTAILGVAWRRVASALRVEHVSEVRKQCDQGSLQVLAEAMKMLETCLRLDTSTNVAKLPDFHAAERILRVALGHFVQRRTTSSPSLLWQGDTSGQAVDGERQDRGVCGRDRLPRAVVGVAGQSQFLATPRQTAAMHPMNPQPGHAESAAVRIRRPNRGLPDSRNEQRNCSPTPPRPSVASDRTAARSPPALGRRFGRPAVA